MKKKHFIFLFSAVIVAGVVLFFCFPEKNIVEKAKKISADLFEYEYIPSQNIDIETRLAFEQKDSIYTDFRKKYRFHYQTLGLASFADSSKLILISEPPPYFVLDSLKSIFQLFTAHIETRTHKIGYDGKIIDVLITLANATDENTQNLLKKLSSELFLSDYKLAITKLPVEENRVYFSENSFDYQISLYEFNDWFLDNEEIFILPEDSNQTFTIPSILKEKKTGVFLSKLPGFTIWAISKEKDMSEQIDNIRKFTLDADLIFGAISDSSTLVVVGREREAALNEIPPLNVETILLLASINEKELSQSLDINDFLAGKMGSGKDWCPTYLSKELENTEFGHLLTITDILLKDWSEKGTIQEAYYRYPKPKYYPFDKPLFRKLGLKELVYNWNTTNAMYAIDLNDKTIYTLNRTGSLPVSYFNSQERSYSIGVQYEQKAYRYFASLGNTDLARVVQYTAIYQLFVDNNISYSGEIHTAFPKNKPSILLRPTKDILSLLKTLSESEIEYLSDTIIKINFHKFYKENIDKQLASNEKQYNYKYPDEEIEKIYENIKKDNKEYIRNQFHQTKNMLQALSEEDFEKTAKYLAYPRGMKINNSEAYKVYQRGRKLNDFVYAIGKQNLSLLGFNLEDIKNYYVNQLGRAGANYLKTPSIIITFNDMNTIGGHNLSSKISRVNSMTNYKKTPTSTSTEQPKPKTTTETKSTSSGKPKTSAPTATSSTSKPKQANIRPRESVVPTQRSSTNRGF